MSANFRHKVPGKLRQLLLLSAAVGLSFLLYSCSPRPVEEVILPEAETPTYRPVINVTGKVVPYTWVELSPAASGPVKELAAEENQVVTAGQVLLALEDVQDVQSRVSAAEVELILAKQALDRLYEQADLERARVQSDLVKAQKELEEALKARSRKDLPRTDQDRIDKALAEYYISMNQVKAAEDTFFDYDDLDVEHIARNQALIDLAEAREERDDKLAALNWYLGQPGELEIAESDVRVALAQSNLHELERDLLDLEKGPDPKAIELAHVELNQAEKNLDSARQSQTDLTLAAPFSGTICRVDTRLLEWVDEGMPVILLADLGNLKVETTDLNEIDVARIDVGNPALVSFDALPGVVIPGMVEKIALKSTQGAGVLYTVEIALAEQPPGLRWDMTAFADIEVSPK